MPASLFGNQAQRRRWLKTTLLRVPGSPLLRFLYIYLLRGGFLDGHAGFTYAMFKFIQTCHVKAKMCELRRGLIQTPSNRGNETPAVPRKAA